ncbi:hypothetical protein IE53DRAFT_247746 [Violaceomyces palustris]|uniref:Uncharacterized protein n=1 Tax=Violaceomyces palustris TaxID=1673888 RepID=A0ACD0NNT1_9BASI|nr:hypothetical protein IE53DRAFT_247746 [Violaceomyces palustris]
MPTAKQSPADARITITTSSELHSHLNQIRDDLQVPETEETWQRLDGALQRLQAITKGGATKLNDYVPLVKTISQPLVNSLLSERTRLSGTAADLINSMAPRLGERFESLVPILIPTLLSICSRTNKVAMKRAEKSLHLISKHCNLVCLLPYMRQACSDKSQSLRIVSQGCMVILIECLPNERIGRKVTEVEACIRSGATDPNPEVRQISKRLFELYLAKWPDRVEA